MTTCLILISLVYQFILFFETWIICRLYIKQFKWVKIYGRHLAEDTQWPIKRKRSSFSQSIERIFNRQHHEPPTGMITANIYFISYLKDLRHKVLLIWTFFLFCMLADIRWDVLGWCLGISLLLQQNADQNQLRE